MRHRPRLLAALSAMLLAAATLSAPACTSRITEEPGSAKKPGAAKPLELRFGTLRSEDSLPLWVAEREGLFEDVGLRAEVRVFETARERDAALTAGAIDACAGDIIAAANLEAGGTEVSIASVMLGAAPAEGRFGVVRSPKVKQVRGTLQVGTSLATIHEYVLEGLMHRLRQPYEKVEVEEVSVRFELLMKGDLQAAVLPEPFLSLAEAQGADPFADDTTGVNLSLAVMVVRDEYLGSVHGGKAVDRLLEAWDRAARRVNRDPDAYRGLLVERARLPEPLQATYEVNTYPTRGLPPTEEVDAVLAWMRREGHPGADLACADLLRP